MASEQIADRRHMLELFTACKEKCSHMRDVEFSELIDECISLWTNMLLAEAEEMERVRWRPVSCPSTRHPCSASPAVRVRSSGQIASSSSTSCQSCCMRRRQASR
eukprot:762947-Hanusia_phi.AAC.1